MMTSKLIPAFLDSHSSKLVNTIQKNFVAQVPVGIKVALRSLLLNTKF